jgi:hypothetical protein
LEKEREMIWRIVRQESWITELEFGYSQLGDIACKHIFIKFESNNKYGVRRNARIKNNS